MSGGAALNREFDLREFLDPLADLSRVSGSVVCPPANRTLLKFNLTGNPNAARHYRIFCSAERLQGRFQIGLGPGDGEVTIASSGLIRLQMQMWRNSRVTIDPGTTINFARIIADNSDVHIGADNLWSDEIVIQTNNQHGVIDLASGDAQGMERTFFETGPHVWLGRRVLAMPNLHIGEGSIVGAGSVVTKSVDPFCAVAGNPARTLREETTWSRDPEGFGPGEMEFLRMRRPEAALRVRAKDTAEHGNKEVKAP